jgi:hypothetical protein
MDSILIPGDMNGDIEFYLPFPLTVSYLKDIKKISFLIQHRYLPHMKRTIEICRTHKYGSEKHKTPTGLFFTNWKAEKRPVHLMMWDLRWNFNIENKLGVGWHQYSFGVSSLSFLLETSGKDAKLLYEWADEWQLADSETVKVKGTPLLFWKL